MLEPDVEALFADDAILGGAPPAAATCTMTRSEGESDCPVIGHLLPDCSSCWRTRRFSNMWPDFDETTGSCGTTPESAQNISVFKIGRKGGGDKVFLFVFVGGDGSYIVELCVCEPQNYCQQLLVETLRKRLAVSRVIE